MATWRAISGVLSSESSTTSTSASMPSRASSMRARSGRTLPASLRVGTITLTWGVWSAPGHARGEACTRGCCMVSRLNRLSLLISDCQHEHSNSSAVPARNHVRSGRIIRHSRLGCASVRRCDGPLGPSRTRDSEVVPRRAGCRGWLGAQYTLPVGQGLSQTAGSPLSARPAST